MYECPLQPAMCFIGRENSSATISNSYMLAHDILAGIMSVPGVCMTHRSDSRTHAFILAFTTRRMVRSAHLSLSPILFTAQFDLPFQIDISTRK